MKLIDNSQIPGSMKPAGPVHEITVQHGERFLVFSTHNCPFEEELSVQLFDADGRELERVDLYEGFAGGLFALKDTRDNYVEFTFWSEDRMRLTYRDQPKRIIRAPLGVHYVSRFSRRHMIVEGPLA